MSTEVKVGQVWRDKDKRRNTVIEIVALPKGGEYEGKAIGLVVGTEEERAYEPERLTKRWELVQEKKPKLTITKSTLTEGEKQEAIVDLVQNVETATDEDEHITREQWLEQAVQALIEEIFIPLEIEVPRVRVSVGWPGGRGPKKNVIGQCFAAITTGDKVAQIFVSPVLEESYAVVETLAHELIHAIAVDENGISAGHKGEFVRIAKSIGFEKPWRETPASDELKEKLQGIAGTLGEYPHSAIQATERPKVQKTYYLKVVCAKDPEYFLRITQTKIDDFGLPLCPCHKQEMEIEEK